MDEKLLSCGIPKDCLKWKIKDFNLPIETEQKIGKFNFATRGYLILAGNNGVGKTSIACSMLREWVTRNNYHDAKFINISHLYLEYLDTMSEYGSARGMIRKYFEPKYLVLDDLGQRTPSDAFLEFLYVVLNERRETEVLTLITTNMNSIEMQAKLGEAIFSRIVTKHNSIKIIGQDNRLALNF